MHVASILAIGAVLVPLLSTPAQAQPGTQDAPFSGTTTAGTAFSDQLNVEGFTPISFTQVTGAPYVTVDGNGAVSAPPTLTAGTYTATGTDIDFDSNTGSWTYTLTVTIAQESPTQNAATVTPADSTAFTDQLVTSGGVGTVTFTQSTGMSDFTVSSSGAITVGATLAVGSYTATGIDSDSDSDLGSWTYTLNVTDGGVSQGSPTQNASTVTPANSTAFTDQLVTTGGVGTVTYTQSTGSADFTVSSSGKITVGATLPVGSYTATGIDSDSDHDTGSWTYTLNVTDGGVSQQSPTQNAATVTPADSTAFTDQLETNGLGTVTYTQSTGSADFTVSSSGKITVGATLAVGSYTATGSDSDSDHDTGSWTYTLNVTDGGVSQGSPTQNLATVTPADSTAFTDQLDERPWNCHLHPVNRLGGFHSLILRQDHRRRRTLAVGSCTATGSDSDSDHDTGSWTYTLNITSATLFQSSPKTNTTTTGNSAIFTDQLATTGEVARTGHLSDDDCQPILVSE